VLEELIDAATWGALPFFLIGLFIWSRKWRLLWLFACCFALAYLLTSKSLFRWNELVHLGDWVDLNGPIVQMLSWSFFGGAVVSVGTWRPAGPPWLASFLTGAVLGPIAAAMILSKMAQDKPAASRLVLSASGGSLIGLAGNPALLTLSYHRPEIGYMFIPLAVLFALIASPRGPDIIIEERSDHRLFVFGLIIATSVTLFPAYSSLIFGSAGILVLIAHYKGINGLALANSVLWTFGVSVLAVGAAATGFPEMAAWEMEELQTLRPDSVLPTLGLGALFTACFADVQGAALLGMAFSDRALDLETPGAVEVLTCGLASGGVLHLFLADVWQESLNRWALQMAACMAYMFFLSKVVFL